MPNLTAQWALRLSYLANIIVTAIFLMQILDGDVEERQTRTMMIMAVLLPFTITGAWQFWLARRFPRAGAKRFPPAFRVVIGVFFLAISMVATWYLVISIVPSIYTSAGSSIVWYLAAMAGNYFLGRFVALNIEDAIHEGAIRRAQQDGEP